MIHSATNKIDVPLYTGLINWFSIVFGRWFRIWWPKFRKKSLFLWDICAFLLHSAVFVEVNRRNQFLSILLLKREVCLTPIKNVFEKINSGKKFKLYFWAILTLFQNVKFSTLKNQLKLFLSKNITDILSMSPYHFRTYNFIKLGKKKFIP